MLDDLVTNYPGVAALTILSLLGVAHTLLQRTIRRLDTDVKKNASDIEVLNASFSALKVEVAMSGAQVARHIADEERIIWPQIQDVARCGNEARVRDAEAHAKILERMGAIEKATAERITRLEVLVRNGGRDA